ncbi:MAG: FtsX-like permease family protein [Luteitalea sp.]|nr:FtsX-like permease family protein [Luteitalea sp.]
MIDRTEGFGWRTCMSIFLQDIRYGLRALLRQRGFATIAVLTLALGIGANSAIFSLLNPLIFRPLRVPDPERLCRVFSGRSGGNVYGRMSYLNYTDLRTELQTFTSLAASSWPVPFSMGLGNRQGGPSQTEVVWGAVVSGNYFTTLGVQPALGRSFLSDEDSVPDARPVVIVSHRLWQTKLAANPLIVGQTLRLNSREFTIIGVAASHMPQTEPPFPADLWVPMMMQAQAMPGQAHKLASRSETWLSVFGRLRPEVTLARARAELDTWARRLEQSYPVENRHLVLPVLTEQDSRTRQIPGVAALGWGVLGVLALVLLIACANIASLLLARSLARRRELAIRASLGANRARLVRQLLTESLLISLLGGLCGLAVASAVTRGLLAMTPPLPIEISLDASIDLRVLLFTLAVSLGSGLLLGILPTLRSVKQDLTSALKTGDTGTGGIHTRMLARDVLVVGQVAVSLVLLITAGLCVRSLQQAQLISVGFDPQNRLLAAVDVGRAGYSQEQGVTFQSRLLEDVRALPGIVGASFTAHPQLGPGYLGDGRLYVEGEAPMPDDRRPVVYYDKVAPRYFEAMGTPLLSGRDFTEQDRAGTRPVGIVNQTLARSFGRGESPLGKRLRLSNAPAAPWIEIVGVVADGKYHSLGEPSQRHLYLPSLQNFHSAMTLVLHTSGDPHSYMQMVRLLVQKLDPDLPVTDVRTMNEHLGFALYPARTTALLFTISGVLGLLLAMIGVYGLLAFVVRQRTREVGIRLALGARSHDVVWLVLRKGIWLLALGLGLGLVAAYATTGLMAGFLYGIDGRDALTFAAAPLFLLLAAVVATAVPARQASRMDPVVALRAE